LELELVREVGIIVVEADISLPSFAPFPLNALKGEELDLDSSTTALPGAYVDV